MSERNLRRRIPVTNRKSRLRNPPSSPSPTVRRTPPATRRPSRSSRPIQILQRCNSEPTLRTFGVIVGGGEDYRNLTPPDFMLFRPVTCTDIFSSPDWPPQSAKKLEGYDKDAKVVVNVTVEGSSGPIRTMMKLGSSVEETIRLAVNKYSDEGRSPLLDKDATSTFELHHSYFSLESLNKSELIGDIGSRSFYLRKSNSDHSTSRGELVSVSFLSSERANHPSLNFFPSFIYRKISKIIRTTHKLWKILGCMSGNG